MWIRDRSPAIRHAKDIAGKIARTDLTVLIEGDNGTGKELFASAIHNASSRARPVSYTHLDVYKRQDAQSVRHAGRIDMCGHRRTAYRKERVETGGI